MLKISYLQMNRFLKLGQAVAKLVIFAFFVLFLSNSCTNNQVDDKISLAEDLLWSDIDSCAVLLEELAQGPLTSRQMNLVHLCETHLRLRTTHTIDDYSSVLRLAELLKSEHDYVHAAEAYYMVGSFFVDENNYFLATYYLKSAENLLLEAQNSPVQLLGLVYYRLGREASQERLFEVANKYYQSALPFMLEWGNPLFLACTYRDLAATTPQGDTPAMLAVLDTALFYARKTQDTIFISDILSFKLEWQGADEFELIPLYHYLCDSLGQLHYASDLIDYYFFENDLSQVEYYLDVLEQDTANNIWTKEHFLYQQAEFLQAKGEKDSAILVLQRLHNGQTDAIETTAYTRTYTVSQYYDLAREEGRNVQLKAEKQRLYMILTLLIVTTLLLISVLMLFRQRTRLKTAEKDRHISLLKVRNSEKQQALSEQLKLRVNLTNRFIHEKSKSGGSLEQMPKLAQELIATMLFVEDDQTEQLRFSINQVFSNKLIQLQQEYPLLTNADLNVCGLLFLQFSMEEICFLLNLNKVTLYKRRRRIKSRLGLTSESNLDEWLFRYAHQDFKN